MKRKILALSLLRLGDIIMATPVLRGLREREPESEIHILINSQFAQLAEMIPYVDRVLFFERDLFQKGLGQADHALFEPYERLRALIADLEAENYDIAINLTQNRLSGYILRLLNGPIRLGLSLDSSGRAAFGSPWFRYLNEQVEADGDDVFHFTDVFRFALGLERQIRAPLLQETRAGLTEANAILADQEKKFIIVQPLTSDVKKDWGLERFASLITCLSNSHPDFDVLVLSAPNEFARLKVMTDRLKSERRAVKLAVCSLAGAFSLLKRCEALVTGDTSIKHLAVAARTPIVEICLGSSDLNRTGAYLQNSVIIRSKEHCAPCVHSQPCHRARRFCAERVSVEAVAMVIGEVIAGDLHQLPVIADEYQDELEILRVETEESGYWAAIPVSEIFSEAGVGRWLSLAGKKVHLEEERLRSEGGFREMGSESVRLERLLRRVYPEAGPTDWLAMLEVMESRATAVENRVCAFQTELKSLYGTFEEIKILRSFVRDLISFREKLKNQPSMKAAKELLDGLIEDDITPPFVRFRRISDALHGMRQRTTLELKLIRNLMDRMEESA